MSIELGDTIVALATPPGRGALSIIRISGPSSLTFLKQLSRRKVPWEQRSREQILTTILDEEGSPIDSVLATFFPTPNSYTGEDMVEISSHASTWINRRILETALTRGLRLARPGEFTERAFLHGKLDLLQAEAVRDLIESETEFQARVARRQMQGSLSRRLQPAKKRLVSLVCQLETALEFVEDELELLTGKEVREELSTLEKGLSDLERSFRKGRITRRGLQISIVGRPNVGKSSLFNALMEEDRAIVTHLPGTTRDALRERVSFEGIPVTLVDTAGLRDAADEVERKGVEKTVEFLAESDLVLFVTDRSEPLRNQDREAWESVRETRPVLVLNKTDRPKKLSIPDSIFKHCRGVVEISALEHRNLDTLRKTVIETVVGQAFPTDEALVTTVRQRGCLRDCLEEIREGAQAYRAGRTEEITLYHLRRALDALGRLTGEVTLEDILGEIFSKFCIGK